jgi:hypothetical protein
MRIHLLFTASLILWSCNQGDVEQTSLTHVTRVVVSPAEFLGDLSCGLPDGMVSYQATLYDVTEGLGRAFQLPSSPVVGCTSDVNFERVLEGHRYIATVVGFDQAGFQSQNPGSPVVVDKSGASVTPRWTTTCWGSDDSREVYGEGGAGPIVDGQGGVTNADGLGTISYFRTEMLVRGCEPLKSDVEPGTANVMFDPGLSLLGQKCGSDAGQVGGYIVYSGSAASSPTEMFGGAGGMGGADTEDESTGRDVDCGETLTWEDWPANQFLTFEIVALDGESGEPRWTSKCTVRTKAMTTVLASCQTFTEL